MEFEKLQEIIAEVMNVAKEDVQPETKFVEDLAADSLDVLQIITEASIKEEWIVEPSPMVLFSTTVFGPIWQSSPMITAPFSCVPG